MANYLDLVSAIVAQELNQVVKVPGSWGYMMSWLSELLQRRITI